MRPPAPPSTPPWTLPWAWSRTWDIRLPSPWLLNISGEPTYFIPLKDQANLVKSYAMVNVARYDIVATADTVTACEQEYIRLLSDRGVTETEDLPQDEASGTVAEIRSAVLEGNTYYFIRLDGEEVSTPCPPRTTPPR